MTATAQVMDRIHDGMSRGLAIYKTAQEYGLSVSRLARQLSSGRKRRTTKVEADQWWQN